MHGETLTAADDFRSERAEALRQAFDSRFAEAPAMAGGGKADLLALSFAGRPFAVRLAETAGLFADRKITPTPTMVPEFRGIAGLRGTLVPVYDLAALMGFAPTAELNWLLLARAAPLAFGFDTFDGQLRLDDTAIAAHQDQAREYVREVAQVGLPRPIIHVASVIAALRRRVPKADQEESLR